VSCSLCGAPEDIDHLLFRCPLAEFVWSIFREALGWTDQPKSMKDILADWFTGKFGVDYYLFYMLSLGNLDNKEQDVHLEKVP
jgi:hypothetical protein